MNNRASRPDSGPTCETSAEVVPTSIPEPSANTEASASAQVGATPVPGAVSASDDVARAAAQQASSLGLSPETVIIQPPAPPPEPPTGRLEDNAVTKSQLAEQLDVSVRTVERWANEGILPAPLRQGRGGMETLFQHDAALVYWGEQTEEARKERRHRQRNRKSLPADALTRESQSRRSRRPGSSS